jgi:hypothetical protein
MENRGSIPGRGNDWTFFLFDTAFRPALGLSSVVQLVPGVLTQAVQQTEREAHSSLPSIAEVKNTRRYTSSPPIHLHDVVFN